MGVFICEKCGRLDNTACGNNYWHASRNKRRKANKEEIDRSYKKDFEYFEDHVCCSDCCKGVPYLDGSGVLGYGKFDIKDKQHWTEIGKEQLLEWESRRNGSMMNATEYFSTICEYLESDVSEETGIDRKTEGF